MVNNKYKRILIITGVNLTSNSATDITLRSYFENVPKEKLLILTMKDTNQPFARTVIIKSEIFGKLRKFFQKILLNKVDQIDGRNLIPGAIVDDNNVISIKQKMFAVGTAYIDMFYHNISKNVIKTIDGFKPEVIYTIPCAIGLIRLTNRISNRYNIPVVPHFMDDWISTIYTGNVLLKLPRIILLFYFKRMLKYIRVGLCISKKMCEEYEIKYHKEFLALMNTINLKNFRVLHNGIKNKSNELVFTFFGGLHLNRWRSLLTLSEVLISLSSIINKSLILEIYTSKDNIEKFSNKFKYQNVIFHDFIDSKSAYLKMQESDFLIHVESFDDSVIKFTRLSISTKIPEYLAAGTPIIAIGPLNIASIEYLNENKCAYVITNLNNYKMQNILLSAIKGVNDRFYSQNSLQLVESNHSKTQLALFHGLFVN